MSTNIGSGERFTTESGLRQGSILSPILFVMYMVLGKCIKTTRTKTLHLLMQTATSIEKLQERVTRWNILLILFAPTWLLGRCGRHNSPPASYVMDLDFRRSDGCHVSVDKVHPYLMAFHLDTCTLSLPLTL